MSNEKRYTARNRVNGWRSKRTYSAAEVAAMQKLPAYKAWVFTELKPALPPPALQKVTKKGTDAGHNIDTGTSGAAIGADPGSADDAN